MNERTVLMMTDAITDAVRAQIPRMIDAALAPHLDRLAAFEALLQSTREETIERSNTDVINRAASHSATTAELQRVQDQLARMAGEFADRCDALQNSQTCVSLSSIQRAAGERLDAIEAAAVQLGARVEILHTNAANEHADRAERTDRVVLAQVERLNSIEARLDAAIDEQRATLVEPIERLAASEVTIEVLQRDAQQADERLALVEERGADVTELQARAHEIEQRLALTINSTHTLVEAHELRLGAIDTRLGADGEEIAQQAEQIALALGAVESIAELRTQVEGAAQVTSARLADVEHALDRGMATSMTRFEELDGLTQRTADLAAGLVDRLALGLGELRSYTDERVAPIEQTQAQTGERIEGLAEAAERALTLAAHHGERLASVAGELRAYAQERIAEEVSREVAALPPAPAGERGPPGEAGRDGVFLGPVIWRAGRHQRGALVSHRNGVWVANVDTDGEPGEAGSGYALMLDGAIPDSSGVETDERGYKTLVFSWASGLRTRTALALRASGWRGVFDPTRTYEPDDMVTCEGSVWVARETCSGIRPGSDASALAWSLCVKRGRDGKDGRNGADGAPGERGEPGTPALGFNFRGPFAKGAAYARNDVVLINASLYIAGNDSSDEGGARWSLFFPSAKRQRGGNGARDGAPA